MGTIAQQFSTAFRDFVTDGVASSGPHEVIKEEVRAIGPLIEAALGAVSLGSVDVIKDTRANLNADLAHPADAVALVYGDATDANNDLYVKVGASGSGSWTLTTILHDAIGGVVAAKVAELVDPKVALAEEWAENPEDDEVTGNPGQFSAKHHSAKASAQRVLAETAAAGAARASRFFHYGSVQFPFENGMTTQPLENGEFRLPGFKDQTTGMGGVGAAAMWAGAASFVAFCDVAHERVNALNFAPMVFATNTNLSLPRTVALRFNPGFVSTSGQRRTFTFYIKGEATDGGWTMSSPQIPDTDPGPFAVYGYNDATNGYLHVFSLSTRTWYDGTAVPKPSPWNGVLFFTNDLAVGGSANYTFPNDVGGAPQNACAWRGAIGNILFANSALSKTLVENIADGADPVTTATGDGASTYLHIPLTDGAGNLSLAVATTKSGMSAGLTQFGTVFPGPLLRRQASAKYITIDRLKWPAFFVRENGASSALAQISGDFAGLTGTVEVRIARRDGVIVRDWARVNTSTSGARWSANFNIPTPIIGTFQIHARMASDPTVIAASHSYCMAGPSVMPIGQSEGEMGTLYGYTPHGSTTTLGVQAVGDTETVVWATSGNGSNAPSGFFHMRNARLRTGIVGDEAMVIANAIRRRIQEPVLIIHQLISGTSLFDLMDDSQSSRTWEDFVGRAGLMQNRGPRGEFIVTGDVIMGWEAFYGGTDVPAAAYIPWLRGIASGLVTNSAGIAQGDIDHWRYDGQFSHNAPLVVLPCNRVTNSTLLSTTDASEEADQRDMMRNYSHILGYRIGPPQVTHKMQGENLAGGIPSGTVTHAEPADWEGTIEMAETNAEAFLMALNAGSYPGPVFFEAIRAGSASNKVVLTLGNPNPHPGAGLAQGSAGYYIDPGEATTDSVVQASTISTAVTINADAGTITTVSQTVAAGAEADFVVNNNRVKAGDVPMVAITNHASAGAFIASVVAVSNGSFTVRLTNLHASAAGNNTLTIGFALSNATRRNRARPIAPSPSAIKLRTKKTGGDPGAGFEASIDGGAWSKANVVSGLILNGREVELTLASTYTTVSVRYHPGSPGGYTSGTITQANWRAGALFFYGDDYADGAPEKLGWAVSGSNMALTL